MVVSYEGNLIYYLKSAKRYPSCTPRVQASDRCKSEVEPRRVTKPLCRYDWWANLEREDNVSVFHVLPISFDPDSFFFLGKMH